MISILLIKPEEGIKKAYKLIKRFERVNKYDLNLKIGIDYTIRDDDGLLAGLYKHKNIIYVNPSVCNKKYNSFHHYIEDYSTFGTTIHEFAHFLSLKYYKNFKKEYLKEFPEDRLLVTEYDLANEDEEEEMAEIIYLDLVNPLFLKLISEKHYNFLRKYYKTPISISSQTFIKLWRPFPPQIKRKIREKWNIRVDLSKKRVYKKIEDQQNSSNS